MASESRWRYAGVILRAQRNFCLECPKAAVGEQPLIQVLSEMSIFVNVGLGSSTVSHLSQKLAFKFDCRQWIAALRNDLGTGSPRG